MDVAQLQFYLFEIITAIAGLVLAYVAYRFISALVSILILAAIVVMIYFYITQPEQVMLVYSKLIHTYAH